MLSHLRRAIVIAGPAENRPLTEFAGPAGNRPRDRVYWSSGEPPARQVTQPSKGVIFLRNKSQGSVTMSRPIEFLYAGRIPFVEGRRIQEDLINRCANGEAYDTIIFCEHPPTLSLGLRTREEHWRELQTRLAQMPANEIDPTHEVDVVQADRGGSITYHGPGQLVIYPVVSLSERRTGVLKFVQLGLETMGSVLSQYGIDSTIKLDPAGCWVDDGCLEKKIASVGLRILHGVTNHGFSLNVCCSLDWFSQFNPCGHPGTNVTSISLLTGKPITIDAVAAKLEQKFAERLG